MDREAATAADQQRQRNEQWQRDYEEARERALRLFLSVLSDEEHETYKREKCIYVHGSRGRRYRIRCAGQSGNVEWVDEHGRMRGRLCAHPGGGLPDPDAWMAQRLILQTDEKHFLDTANLHWGERPEPRGLVAA
jgi:hypothetical protein